MRKDILNMSQKERQRYHLLQMVLDGKNNLKDAGKRMEVSYRHAKRLKKKLITEGAKGPVYGNRGRPSPKALNRELAERIIVARGQDKTMANRI